MSVNEELGASLEERLRAHRVIGGIPDEEIAWLLGHGEVIRYDVGFLVSSPRLGPVRDLYIVLAGRMGMYVDRGGGPRRVIQWGEGDVTGFLPYSRMNLPPGEGIVEEPVEVFSIPSEHIPELTRECPVLTARLVQKMLDRARHFTEDTLHDEKMKSLGRLSAGLAHELDNPASAVVRSAKLLIPLVHEAEEAARELGASNLTAADFERIVKLRDRCPTAPVNHVRSPLEQARREEEVLDWLDERGIVLPAVETLADSPITPPMLDEIAESVDPRVLRPALRWVASSCALLGMAAELGQAASRISELVRAVKGYTQMDSGAASHPVDVETGLSQTLLVYKARAREKAVRVTVRADPDLPRVAAFGGELNQVWSNLLANAIDAVPEGGSVDITAEKERDRVVVRFIDDGPGVPDSIRERIFDPFFTTKGVGKGTGLGLDIVRRLVERQHGTIELDSRPGRTEFRISLPIADAAPEPAVSR